MSSQTDHVSSLIEHALADPHAVPGRRIKSERDLALLLGVGRRQINEALSHLAHRGLLARSRGSGTYVVQRPQPSEAESRRQRQAWDRCGLTRPDEVFAPEEQAPPVTDRRRSTPALRLCLCGDWLDGSSIHHAIIDRMLATVQQHGHTLSVVSVLDSAGCPLSPDALREQLKKHPADGYLVVDRWGELFTHAMRNVRRPVVFCGNSCGLRHEPAVGFCHNDVAVRALRRLSEAGFSKIAMLGYHHACNSIEPQRDAYDRAADALGLQYRHCELVRFGDLRPGASVRRLLDPDNRPEAIYLSDEYLAPALIEAVDSLGITFGRDMGLVCFCNRGISTLPDAWSRLEIDIRLAGQLAVEALMRTIETGEEYPGNLVLHPRWLPAQSHICPELTPTRQAATQNA